MRILIVEDDKYLSSNIRSGLEKNGYAVDGVGEGKSAIEMVSVYGYDVIILDIMLPDINGFTVCKSLRSKHIEVPILMLTARSLEDDRVRGLDCGADDYLVKPFGYPELLARIRALLRRTANNHNTEIRVGQLVLDTIFKNVKYSGNPINLTAKEYAILEYLVVNHNGVVTREMLEEHIWNCDREAFTNVIEVLVGRIRKKLNPDDKEAVIKTVRGLGYVVKD